MRTTNETSIQKERVNNFVMEKETADMYTRKATAAHTKSYFALRKLQHQEEK